MDGERRSESRDTVNRLSGIAVDLAIRVHRNLGPGLLESVYHRAFVNELGRSGMQFESQASIPIVYEGIEIGEAYKADIVIDNSVILELKSVDSITDLHKKQLLTYLKLSGPSFGPAHQFQRATTQASNHADN